ncbi:MAG: hypothetical protein Greene041619_497, partial [Candidatus Peregrinibacteria bacterium Greene0416_19]
PEAECRLCFDGIIDRAIEEGAKVLNAAHERWEWLRDTGGPEFKKWVIEKSQKIPPALREGMKYMFGDPPDQKELATFVFRADEFLKAMPTLAGKIDEHFNNNKIDALNGKSELPKVMELMNHQNWIDVFREIDANEFLAKPDIVVPDPNDQSGKALLLRFAKEHLSVEERRKIFAEYVNKYVTNNVSAPEKATMKIPEKGMDAREVASRLVLLGNELKDLTRVVGGVVGEGKSVGELKELGRRDQKIVVTRSLQGLYQDPAKMISKELTGDFSHQVDLLRRQGKLANINVESLKTNAELSPLKGALENEFIKKEQLAPLTANLNKLAMQGDMAIGGTRWRLNGLTNPELRDPKTFGQLWNNLGGVGQLAVVALLIYGIIKHPIKTLVAAAGIAGLKAAGIDVFQGLANIAGKSRKSMGTDRPWLNEHEMHARARQIAGMMSECDPAIAREAQRFAIVTCLPLQDVADSVTVINTDKAFGVQFNPSREAYRKLQANGWDVQQIRSLLGRPSNDYFVGLSYIFYKISLRENPNSPDALIAQKILGRQSSDKTITALLKEDKEYDTNGKEVEKGKGRTFRHYYMASPGWECDRPGKRSGRRAAAGSVLHVRGGAGGPRMKARQRSVPCAVFSACEIPDPSGSGISWGLLFLLLSS